MSKFNERAYKLFEEWSIKTHGKMSQPKVVDFTGIPQATISKIKISYENPSEKQFQPPAETILKIAKAFNISTDYLLGLTDKGIVKTNRDKLNAMSNDEIKDFFCGALEQIYDDCRVEYDMCEPCPFRKYCRYKHNGFLHWLEMEAEDEAR